MEKNSARIAAYGTVDELNSLIGVVLSDLSLRGVERRSNLDSDYKRDRFASLAMTKKLERVQAELMVLGSNLATPKNVKVKIPKITRAHITRLEKEIDRMDRQLLKLKNFILPGGSSSGSKLHLARATARRAERAIVTLAEEEKINAAILPYINRLSDWLFVLARYANKLDGETERIWKGRSKT